MFSRRFLCEAEGQAEIQPQLSCSTRIVLQREAVLPVKPVPSFGSGQSETSWDSPPEEEEEEELLDLVLSPRV